MRRALIHGLLLAMLATGPPAPPAAGQVVCPPEHDRISNACPLGTPSTSGITLQGRLTRPDDQRTYKIVVPESMSAHVYLGDLWYDLDLSIWRDPPVLEPGAILPQDFMVAASRFEGRRTVQFARPQFLVVPLDPGSYTIVVSPSAGIDPSRPYTLRVALSSPICAFARDAAETYQIALAYQPAQPTPFSLLTFTAFVSPPFADLFEFDWSINGRPAPEASRETLQVAVPDLPRVPAGGSYQVEVTARGVREYPDPEPRFRHIPPTLRVACSFRVP